MVFTNIGGRQVGEVVTREESGRKTVVFKCRNCPFSANPAGDPACRAHLTSAMGDFDGTQIVLEEKVSRVFNEDQTKMFVELAALKQKLNLATIWSYANVVPSDGSCDALAAPRSGFLAHLAFDKPDSFVYFDPIRGYVELVQEIAREQAKLKAADAAYKRCTEPYVHTLLTVKAEFDKTRLVQKSRPILAQSFKIEEIDKLYYTLFESDVKPFFVSSRLTFKDVEEMELLDQYEILRSSVQIFSHPDKIEPVYMVNPPEYQLTTEMFFVYNRARDVVSGFQAGTARLSDAARNRKYYERMYESTIRNIANHHNIKLSNEEVLEVAEIIARYSIGYGILEILLSDPHLTDVYIDAPTGQRPIYVVHQTLGQCQTNIFYSPKEAESLVSKIRSRSGRPFDEAHPVLDYDLEDVHHRVAAIMNPLSPDGIAFAFRAHGEKPWTLPRLMTPRNPNENGAISPLGAGLLSFLVDNDATALIAGSRGSGKTTLLQALMLEINLNKRILCQEDTLELPIRQFKQLGLNIQSLKTRSPISVSKSDTEVAPEESLRTALRLGDSVLILGEVRSKEAKVLYEAMRVGAAGNVVMGTIHGDSAYSIWDRVVHDLDVPTTSFKATDYIVVARPIRPLGGLRQVRRVFSITEVTKHWNEDPEREGGLLDIMLYDAKTDQLELLEDNLKDSELFSRMSAKSGLSLTDMWKEIRARAQMLSFLSRTAREQNLFDLLEAEYYLPAHNRFILLKNYHIDEFHAVDWDKLLEEWKAWVLQNQVAALSAAKPAGR